MSHLDQPTVVVWPNSISVNSYIFLNQRETPETLFLPPQASILLRSHIEAFSGTLLEGNWSWRPPTSSMPPSDDAWVVYHKPRGPQLVPRWLLLSLWSSIPCYSWSSWRSIRCNTLLRCVCRDPMNCEFMFRLSMNIIWISSEFLYAWFHILASLFELFVWFGQLDW